MMAALASPAAVSASKVINVSGTVTGTVEQQGPHLAPKVPCGAQCTYAIVSSARMVDTASATAGTVAVTSWPPTLASAPAAPPAVERDGTVPAPFDDPQSGHNVFDGAVPGVSQRAAVEFDPAHKSGRSVSSDTYATGSGSAVLTYTVQLTTGPASANWYVDFKPPVLTRIVRTAFFIGGPSGNEPIDHQPDATAARSAVDVYVDGLPVWSSESSHHVPATFDGQFAADAIQLSWDRSLGGSRTVLYLGLLPPGLTLNIALLVRVDEQIDAPDCFTDHMSLPVNTTIHHCHEQLEALSLPAKRTSAGTRLDVNVYSR